MQGGGAGQDKEMQKGKEAKTHTGDSSHQAKNLQEKVQDGN